MMHTDLEVYKSSMQLVCKVYKLTKDFPRDELWGLTSQMKRAVVSIPANIAEGCGRKTPKELLSFLYIALGSITELSTHIEIAKMLGFVKDLVIAGECVKMAETAKRQLIALIKANELNH